MNVSRHTIINALHVAAKVYDNDAHTSSCVPGHERIEQAFIDQAKEARELADAIENGATLRLED